MPMSPPDGLMVPTNDTTMMKASAWKAGKASAGRGHQHRTGEQHAAQFITRREVADREREQRRSEQRGGRHDADDNGIEAERRKIGGQNNDGEAVAKPARGPRGEQDGDVATPCVGRPVCHLRMTRKLFRPCAISSTHRVLRRA